MLLARTIFLATILCIVLAASNERIVAQADPCAANAYDIWLAGYGGGTGGDFNGDGKTDGRDYIVWLNKQGHCGAPEYHPTVDIGTAHQENPNFPDVSAYCQSLGYQGMAIVDQQPKAYGVLCVRNGTELANIDMNAMCKSIYGADSKAQITNQDSAYGWVCDNGTTSQSQQQTTPIPTKIPIPVIMGSPRPTGTFSIQATDNNVNVRTGPGTDNAVIGQISPNSGYFESIGASNGWLHIRFSGGEGWVRIDYVHPADTNSSVPTTQPTLQPTPQLTPILATHVPALPVCPVGSGPGGITAGGYTPQDLTQEQRQWLFEKFGHSGTAPVGYGGESCTQQASQTKICPTNATGPGGIAIGGYDPKTLTQEQRQWLFEQFGHSGTAPVGYGGETCSGGQPSLLVCPAGVGEPGGFNPTSLTQQQRNDLFHAFGHSGEAPVGYGGEACTGGQMTLASFVQSTAPTPLPQPTIANNTLPIDYGSSSPLATASLQITASRGLNIRSGPGEGNSIVGLAASGGYFEIIGGLENGWYKIRFSGGEGWVNSQYVVNTTIVTTPETTPHGPVVLPLTLSDSCIAVESATLTSSNSSSMATCINSIFEDELTPEESYQLVEFAADCGVTPTSDVIEFFSWLAVTEDPAAAVTGAGISAETVASCLNTGYDTISTIISHYK